MHKHLPILIVLFALAALAPHAAEAMSAFAAGVPASVATQGVAFGDSWNYPTRDQAEAQAMAQCRQQDAPAATTALCKITAYFDNECLAVALDPQAGTPGYGWAIAATADLANALALGYCRQSAGPTRVDACVISVSKCDTNPPIPKAAAWLRLHGVVIQRTHARYQTGRAFFFMAEWGRSRRERR